MVAHNASFDINFVNYELKQLGKSEITWDRVVDTLEIARLLFPGARCNLDALCKRFDIDNSNRTLHGRCLMPSCLPKSIWNFWAAGNPVCCLMPKKTRRPQERRLKFLLTARFFAKHAVFPCLKKNLKIIRNFWKRRLKGRFGTFNSALAVR